MKIVIKFIYTHDYLLTSTYSSQYNKNNNNHGICGPQAISLIIYMYWSKYMNNVLIHFFNRLTTAYLLPRSDLLTETNVKCRQLSIFSADPVLNASKTHPS